MGERALHLLVLMEDGFGGLTGADVKLDVQALYTNQIKLIGSTGGTRKEFQELIDIASKEGLKVKVWKKFKLADVKEALKALFAKDRSGRRGSMQHT